MTTYWVDHGGSNTAPYDTQVKAATTLATILAIPPAAGDIIYCCDNAGTGEVTAGVLSLASSGTNAGGFIKVIGCNSSGTVDGTRYVIDANNGDFDIIDLAGHDMWWWENIEVKNNGGSSQNGIYNSTGASEGHVFVNCCANDCTGNGLSVAANMSYPTLIRCVAYSNVGKGIAAASAAFLFCCCARDNTDSGISAAGSFLVGCVSHGNTNDGIENFSGTGVLLNCVVDANADDGIVQAANTNLYHGKIIGCRVTNHSGSGDIGLNCNSEAVITGWNYFENNAGDNIQNKLTNGYQFIPLEGGSSDSNLEDLSNTDYGYVDSANHDFSIRYVDSGDPDLRRTAITVPWT